MYIVSSENNLRQGWSEILLACLTLAPFVFKILGKQNLELYLAISEFMAM